MEASILWIDSSLDGESNISSRLKVPFQIREVRSAKDARHFLNDESESLAAIYLNPMVAGAGTIGMIESIRRARPLTPVYLTYRTEKPLSDVELGRLAVNGCVKLKKTEEIWKETLGGLDAYQKVSSISRINDPQMVESTEKDGFIPIPSVDLLGGAKTFFDIYLRFPSGRYLKIVDANDVFAPSRVRQYLSKGITHFYISKNSHQRMLGYCRIAQKTAVDQPGLSMEVKISQCLSRGSDLMEQLREHGLTDRAFQDAQNFVSAIHRLSKELYLSQKAKLAQVVYSLGLYENAVGTVFVASLVARTMEMSRPETLHAIGLSALLHDIGLYDSSLEIQNEDFTRLTPKEESEYIQHPLRGAEILEQFENLDPVIIQAVAQHHERRDGGGFPLGLGPGHIHPIAEIVGISDEFIRILQQRGKNPGIDPFRVMEEEVFNGFSAQVVNAFQTVFRQSFLGSAMAKNMKRS